MILISQGHEQSVGLEILFKSLSLLSPQNRKHFLLVAYQSSIDKTLQSINSAVNISGLNYHLLQPTSNNSQSQESLQYCLENITPQDILITLPTSKDQLKGEGHTQFFRQFYKKEYIAMVFELLNDRMMLITDHIPLKDVTATINSSIIISKVQTVLDGYSSLNINIQEVIFAGINPHAGEKGLLGNEETVIEHSISKLAKIFPNTHFKGPYSADTLHFHRKNNCEQIFVYMYHDQGLPKFKNEYGTLGVHLSFGLPFLRMSVDHGTAFDLYKKNCAHYMGMYNVLNRALECL